MKIVISDPSKFTAPYDYSLCNSLVENNVDITVLTSKFMYGEEIPNKKYTEIDFINNLKKTSSDITIRVLIGLKNEIHTISISSKDFLKEYKKLQLECKLKH